MCVIVDTNAFAAVFNANANNHDEFAPVLDWISKNEKVSKFCSDSKY